MGFYTTIALVIFLVQTSQLPLAFSQGGPTTAQSSGILPSDWPSFNRDSSNSSFTPLKGDMNLQKPKLKWAKEIPDLWTGFTFSSQGGFLACTPIREEEVILLNPLTGEIAVHLLAPERITPKTQGTGEGIPLFKDVTGDGVAELFATMDSYGIVVWDLARKTVLWSRPIHPQWGDNPGDLNAILGDINGDGRDELVVMVTRTLRMLECYDARTGKELWCYTDRDLPCTEGSDCKGGWDYDWLQGTITQNFPVWFSEKKGKGPTRLLFQHQTSDSEKRRGVDIICIETNPTLKSMTFWNNPPGPYSNTPLQATSHVSPKGDPEVGRYQLDFYSPNRASVNGGIPKPIVAGGRPNEEIIKGLELHFSSEAKAGDKVIIEVHRSPRRVWKRSFYTGYCFAHFLLGDFNNDGEEEIAFGTVEKYYLIDKDGNLLWEYDTGIPARTGDKNMPYEDIVWGGAFADIDNDGIKEIVFDAFDTLVCLRGDTGGRKWGFKVPRVDFSKWPNGPGVTNFLRAYPLIADLDGDGELEVVTADSEFVYAINKNGQPVMKYRYAKYYFVNGSTFTLDGKSCDMPFTAKRFIFADIDGDGKGELVGSMRLREGNELYHRVFCLE
ncbi:MAG TPA: FG-GAP repeat domain-containing protein [Candidatus Tripitaka californicus]|uniref:FG-GAP repeat domain-containing protein n=1 Tax=Candidatus Tripitaka californicus TaxID=3367616 RepID=UPI0040250474|nr:VCBS repeat-containing protein [Planctomycetota bacterium]